MSGEAKTSDVHKGHRKRIRERFINYGADNFQNHELLELLLTYAIPRIDVNPLAHSLLDEFGSLAGVLNAQPEDLCQVEGIGESAAALLHLMPALFQRYSQSHVAGKQYDSPEKLAEYLMSYYVDKTCEQAVAILLDNNCRIIRLCQVGEGTPSSVLIDTRKLVQCAMKYNAANVVLGHNHPSGSCRPSRQDIRETTYLRDLLKSLGAPVVDHIVIGQNEWISMNQSMIVRF